VGFARVVAARGPGPSTTIQILDEPPASWIDPATGHRVVRLTREPGSASLYFTRNGYTADGKKLVYSTPGVSVLDLATRNPGRLWKAARA